MCARSKYNNEYINLLYAVFIIFVLIELIWGKIPDARPHVPIITKRTLPYEYTSLYQCILYSAQVYSKFRPRFMKISELGTLRCVVVCGLLYEVVGHVDMWTCGHVLVLFRGVGPKETQSY